MITKDLEQRERQFREFGKLLVQRYRHNYEMFQNDTQETVTDEAAVRFGRYLRAARANAGLSPKALAFRSGVSSATILALEQGLILPQDIRPKWLNKLADGLGEDAGNFNLLLGAAKTQRISWSRQWLNRLRQPINISFRLHPVYASLPALLLCIVLSAMFLFRNGVKTQNDVMASLAITPEGEINLVNADMDTRHEMILVPAKLINIDPEDRMNLIEAENQVFLMPEMTKLIEIETDGVFEITDVEPDFGTQVFLLVLPDTSNQGQPKIIRAEFDFTNHFFVVPTLTRANLEGRPSVIKPEVRLENQILVWPTLIDIAPEDRLSMLKAENRL